MNVVSPRTSVTDAITIGVIGTRELVERIMTAAHHQGGATWRLVGAAYAEEHQARDRLRTIESKIDVCLFGGPLPYDLARAEADLAKPATHVPVSGAALYSTLLRGVLDRSCDPERVSVDTVSEDELAEAYAEIGIDTENVHVHAYEHPSSAASFLDFHRRLHDRGATSAALTTVPRVEHQLVDAGIPVLRMIPTYATLRIALNTAALLGTGNRLEEAQIAIVVVQPTAASRPAGGGASNYWHQELKLALYRELLHEARRMDAAVLPRDPYGYMLVTTLGSLNRVTDGFRVAPFLERVQQRISLPIEVGVGLGMTARDAEEKAQTAVEKATSTPEVAAYVMGPGDGLLALSPTAQSTTHVEELHGSPRSASKGSEALDRLLERMSADDRQNPVDADKVAALLGVTSRTARRLLTTLVDEGLAWPLPPVRSAGAGRPRQPYQLITHRTGDGRR